MAINFNKLLNDLITLISDEDIITPTKDQFSGWQPPIKGTFYNSGNYSPGVATDKRHATGHNGVDLRAPGGTPVFPIELGVVEKVDNWEKGGNIITILHPKNVRTYYAHLGTISVKPGQKVNKSTQIGTVGDSGNAKGTYPHIHFEVKVNGQLQNPSNFFNIPPYSKPTQNEQAWLSDQHKYVAQNFDASKIKKANSDLLLNITNEYLKLIVN